MPRTAAIARDQLVREALDNTNWDLLACAMPFNILLLSGYWPAAGSSVALATRGGEVAIIVPEDDAEIARNSWADEIATYDPAPLDRLISVDDAVFESVAALKRSLGIAADRIGFEQGELSDPASNAPNVARGGAARLLRRAFPSATLAPADEMLAQLRAVKTPAEIDHIRNACRIAGNAFQETIRVIRPGLTEAEVSAAFRMSLASCLGNGSRTNRCDGFVACMSGPNSVCGFGRYPRSRSRRIESGDLVIVHCTFYADGYWADVARTYSTGQLRPESRRMFQAALDARDAVLSCIRPGKRASELDHIAADVYESYGLSHCMKHAIGHGTGFQALDHTARPRLHPKSDDVLEAGMVLKLEPGLYSEAYGGVRRGDVVAVTDNEPEVLTSFHWDFEHSVLPEAHA